MRARLPGKASYLSSGNAIIVGRQEFSMGGCMHKFRTPLWVLAALSLAAFAARSAPHSEFTLPQVLHYPYANELAAAEQGDVIAWVDNIGGVRNIWVARGPAFTPLQVTQYT